MLKIAYKVSFAYILTDLYYGSKSVKSMKRMGGFVKVHMEELQMESLVELTSFVGVLCTSDICN